VPDGYHPPIEEYLETIFSLTEEGIPVIQARLVERLSISAQSVSEMIHRLAEQGFVERDGRGVSLTALGQRRAESVVRRHRLAERFLVDVVGLPWHQAHLEAGRWEHVISDVVEQRFVELLDHPTTCPHGSIIPGSGGVAERQSPLSGAVLGTKVHLTRVTEQLEMDLDALVYLSEHTLIPGQDARVVGRAPDGTLTLELDSTSGDATTTIAVGPDLARQIFISAA
jgi:DtxR family transcriptional regulator, Mn-dependent transcriptional regulator